jgi:hypothetical protein
MEAVGLGSFARAREFDRRFFPGSPRKQGLAECKRGMRNGKNEIERTSRIDLAQRPLAALIPWKPCEGKFARVQISRSLKPAPERARQGLILGAKTQADRIIMRAAGFVHVRLDDYYLPLAPFKSFSQSMILLSSTAISRLQALASHRPETGTMTLPRNIHAEPGPSRVSSRFR